MRQGHTAIIRLRLTSWVAVCVLALGALFPARPPAYAQPGCAEPNDTREQACSIEPGQVAGLLDRQGDVDVYRFESRDFGVTAQLLLGGPAAAGSATVRLEGWGGRVLDEAATEAGTVDRAMTLPAPGAYYIVVSGQGAEAAAAPYDLTLRLAYPAGTPDVLYRNPFRTPENADWIEQTGSPHRFEIDGGGLRIVPDRPEPIGITARAWAVHFRDLTLTVDGVVEEGWIDDGNTGLLVGVRNTPRTPSETGPSDDYWIDVESAGRTLISVRQYEARQWLVPPVMPPQQLQPGETVRITVRMQDDELEVFLNGVSVMRSQDATFSAGRIMLGAYTNGLPMRARFDDLLVTTPTNGQVSGPLLPGIDRSPGAILFQETFDDPAASRIAASTVPGPVEREIADGQIALRIVDPSYPMMPSIALPVASPSASVEADATIVGDTPGRFVALICRDQASTRATHYRLAFSPDTGRFTIGWWDEGTEIPRVRWTESPAILRGNATNHVELSCSDTTISARFNGVEVARVTESALPNGRFIVSGGVFTVNKPATSDVRFDNVVVRQI